MRPAIDGRRAQNIQKRNIGSLPASPPLAAAVGADLVARQNIDAIELDGLLLGLQAVVGADQDFVTFEGRLKLVPVGRGLRRGISV